MKETVNQVKSFKIIQDSREKAYQAYINQLTKENLALNKSISNKEEATK